MTRFQEPFMHKFMSNIEFIGVDVSAETLNIAQKNNMAFTDSAIANEMAAIESWLDTLGDQTQVVFEATGVYSHKLEFALSVRERPFSKVNPTKIKGFAHACGQLSKTDKQDARLIQRYGEGCRPSPSPALKETEIRKSRLRQALAVLEKQAQDLRNQQHVLAKEPLALPAIADAYEQMLGQIETHRATIRAELTACQTEAERAEINLLKTIGGIGPVCSEELVAATGSIKSFDSAKKLAKFIGLAPVEAYSGVSVRRKLGICRTAVPIVRAKLFMAVTGAVKSNPPCKQLFDRLVAKGKSRKLARIAVAHKLVRQAFGVIHSNQPFQPDFETKMAA
jgi:transposase